VRRHAFTLQVAAAVIDGLAVLALIVILSRLRWGADWDEAWSRLLPDPAVLALSYAITSGTILWLAGHYRIRARRTLRDDVAVVLRSTAVLAALSLGMLYLLHLPDVSRLFMLLLFPAQFTLTLLIRAPARLLLLSLWRRGKDPLRVMIIGADTRARRFAERLLSHRELGVQVVGFVSDGDADDVVEVLGRLDDLEDLLHRYIVDEVVVCLPFRRWDKVEAVAQLCQDEGKAVRIPIDLPERAMSRGWIDEIDGVPLYAIGFSSSRLVGLALKRLTDVASSLPLLIALSPLLLATAAVILIVDGRPVLFRQTRLGLSGRPFTIMKFRTMRRDAEGQLSALMTANEISGHAFKLQRDPRVTRLGRLLRRTSLDELPQLWNVLIGEMSLVGPRPPLPEEVARYDIWHRRRLSMKPGITGLWQVRRRHEPDFDKWVQTDLEYIDKWSLWLDLKILAETIPAVLTLAGR
jgi:exopolysaccharide biosynthesis polyprenyl glycosylphosphotransferase